MQRESDEARLPIKYLAKRGRTGGTFVMFLLNSEVPPRLPWPLPSWLTALRTIDSGNSDG